MAVCASFSSRCSTFPALLFLFAEVSATFSWRVYFACAVAGTSSSKRLVRSSAAVQRAPSPAVQRRYSPSSSHQILSPCSLLRRERFFFFFSFFFSPFSFFF